MRIRVRLFSRYRDLLPPEARGQVEVDLPPGATLAQLVDRLGIVDRISLITVNGQRESNGERSLSHGDLVFIFPPVVGG